MNIFKNAKILKKILIFLVFISLFNFIVIPKKVCAFDLKTKLVSGCGKMLYGAAYGLATLPEWLAVTLNNLFCVEDYSAEMWDGNTEIFLSPETIITGKFALMNANIFEEIKDQDVKDGLYYDASESDDSTVISKNDLRKTVSQWYVALRNLSAVAMLSVIVYVAIRMVMSSASKDKAKYKAMFKDWVIGLLLVIFMHLIMVAMLNITSIITSSMSYEDGLPNRIQQERDKLITTAKNIESKFSGLTEYDDIGTDIMPGIGEMIPEILIYAALVTFTVIFVVKYMIRAMLIMLLTIIAPITAITYPIDKIGDGKSQAYNMWFREYFFNVIIQPFHLLIYIVLIGAAQDLANQNIFYCILCYAMMFPAEKLVKKMFGLDKAKTGSPFAAGAATATLASLMNRAKSDINRKNQKSSNSGKNNVNNSNDYGIPPKEKNDSNLSAYLGSDLLGKSDELPKFKDENDYTDEDQSLIDESDKRRRYLAYKQAKQERMLANGDQIINSSDGYKNFVRQQDTIGQKENEDENSNGQSINQNGANTISDNSQSVLSDVNNNQTNQDSVSGLRQFNRGIGSEIGKGYRARYGTTDLGFHGVKGTISGFKTGAKKSWKNSKGRKVGRLTRAALRGTTTAIGHGIKGHFSSENRNSIAGQSARKITGAVGRIALRGGMAALAATTVGMFAIATGNPKAALGAISAAAELGRTAGKGMTNLNTKISSETQRYIKAGVNAAKGEGASRKTARKNFLQNQSQRDYVTQRLRDKYGYTPSGKEVDAEMELRWNFIEDNGITDNRVIDAEIDLMEEKQLEISEVSKNYLDSIKGPEYDDVQHKLENDNKYKKDYKALSEGKITEDEFDQKYGNNEAQKAKEHQETNIQVEKYENTPFSKASYAAQIAGQYNKNDFKDEEKMQQLQRTIINEFVAKGGSAERGKVVANAVIKDAAKVKGEKSPAIPGLDETKNGSENL